ncbi:MAG: YihY/virulence factor BrkB family protein [Snowella sp.]|nr:YihY/virulence factor BrkB family protein [Snowella sp.]
MDYTRYFRDRILPSKFAQLGIQTIVKWQKDECLEMGAALAYYALFSLFPICLVILSIVGFILGPTTDTHTQLLTVAQNILPAEPFKIFKETLLNLNQSSIGAGLVGFFLLLLTASKIFEALNRSVDKIWDIHNQPQPNQGVKEHIISFVKDKILAFFLVLSTVLVLLASMLSNVAIQIILTIVKQFENVITGVRIDNLLLIRGLQIGISFFLIMAVIMGLFKVLPSSRVKWQDIWLGAVLTVFLLMLLQNLVSSGFIQIGEQFRAYGVIGNVMVLLLWIYLIFQIFFLGCEFSYVYTHLFGSRRQP